MDPLVRELALFGLSGMPLDAVPDELKEAISQSDIGEIRKASEVEKLKTHVFGAELGEDFKNAGSGLKINDLQPQADYVLRLKTSEWHNKVLRGFRTTKDVYFWIVSELIVEPKGLTIEALKDRIKQPVHDFNRRVKQLAQAGVILNAKEAEDSSQPEIDSTPLYIYNWNWPIRGTQELATKPERSTSVPVISLQGCVADEPKDIQKQFEAISEFIKAKRVVSLTDERDTLKKLYPSAFNSDCELFIKQLEQNGLKVVEIEAKYTPWEFIIHCEDVSEDDSEYQRVLTEVKERMIKKYKKKVWQQFFLTNQGKIEDNGFITSKASRAEIFLKFMFEKLARNGNQLFFARQALMEMDFLTFVSCIPLRHEWILVAVAACYAEEAGRSDEFPVSLIADLLNGVSPDPLADFAAARRVLEGAAEKLKLLDAVALLNDPPTEELVLCFPQHKACAFDLVSKATPGEFVDIFSVLVKYGIFSLGEQEEFFFFDLVDGIEPQLTNIMNQIHAEEDLYKAEELSLNERVELFFQLLEPTQEEFSSKAHDIISRMPTKPLRARYYKRLARFIETETATRPDNL